MPVMTEEEWADMVHLWEQSGSLEAPEGEEEADELDGVTPLWP